MSPRRPLLGVAILYALGIWVGSAFSVPVVILLGMCAGLLAAFFLVRRHPGFLFAAIFVGGMLAYALATFTSPLHLKNQIGERRVNIGLRGVVVGMPVFEERPDSTVLAGRSKVELRVSAWKETDEWMRAEGKVMAVLPVEKEKEPPEYGDELEIRGVIGRPPPAMNFGQFDYRKELERQRIFYLVHARNPNDVTVVARRRGNPMMSAALDSRGYLRRALRCGIEEDRAVTGLLEAILLGIRETVVTQGQAVSFFEKFEAFQASGVAHIFAVSGLNVALVAGVMVMLLAACRVPRGARMVIVIPALIFYVLVTGAQPSAVRALIMAVVLLVGWGLRKMANVLNSVAAAAVLALLIDPLDLFGTGFQLSFAAVIAIVILAPPLMKWWQEWIAPDPWIPARCVSVWRYQLQPITFWFSALASSSLAAWLGTLPLTATNFHLFAPVALLANLLVVPAMTLVTVLGMFSIGSFFLWPWLAATWNNANWLLIQFLTVFVEFCGRVHGGHFYLVAPSGWVVAGYYGLLLLVVGGWLWKRTWRWLAVGATGAAVGIWWLAVSGIDDTVRITVLHTDGGHAVYVEPPREAGLLIDAGSESAGQYVVIPFLRGCGVDRLAAVVMSHGEASYVGGFGPVLEKIPVRTVFDTDAPTRSKTHRELRNKVRKNKFLLRTVHRGDRIEVVRDLTLRVLHPPPSRFSDLADDNSIVLMLDDRGKRVLFTAAAGETVERELLAGGEDLRADIIIKGQHERETSCTDEFLDQVRPQVVIFSAGDYPPSAYPQPETLERLARHRIRVYRTDQDGAVKISLTQTGWSIKTFGSDRPTRSGEVLPAAAGGYPTE